MTVVVDLGCYTHPAYPEDESTMKLIERFRPGHYIGFDPHPGTAVGVRCEEGTLDLGLPARYDLAMSFHRLAAWTHDGTIAYDPHPDRPLAASVGSGALVVPCFDLARWLRGRDFPGPLILKMDVEGAEYALLPDILAAHVDRLVHLLLVEWHHPPIGPPGWEAARDEILAGWSGTVEDW